MVGEFRHRVNTMLHVPEVVSAINQYYDMLEERGITARAHERVTDGE